MAGLAAVLPSSRLSAQTAAGTAEDERFMRMAIAEARLADFPFGAVIVRGDAIVATGVNEIVDTHDPSAHAEMQAIRSAAMAQRSPRFDGCVMYASGHPCPMCLALMHMTGFTEVYYAYSNEDGESFGLSTRAVYEQMALPLSQQNLRVAHVPVIEEGEMLYQVWQRVSRGEE